jgi:hypothetical protein
MIERAGDPQSSWEARRLWSLWDMLDRFLLVRFCSHLKSIYDVEYEIDSKITLLEFDKEDGKVLNGIDGQSPFISKEDKDDAAKIFIDFREHSERYGFERTLDRIDRLLANKNVKLEDYKHELKTLREAIIDDARRRYFFYLQPEKTKRYFDRNSYWKDVKKQFRSTKDAIEEAEASLLVDANSSAVYQAMMILEKGLKSLANELGVEYGLDHWAVIIQNIESEISKQEKKLAKGDKKLEILTFYGNAGLEFRYFKVAWRNHVAHARGNHDAHQALSIISHVHDFMAHLSTKLGEVDEEEKSG